MITFVQETGLPLDRCPTCGTRTVQSHLGEHPSLCQACTEEEIGETYEQLRDRVTAKTAKGSKKKWNVV